MQKHIVFIYYIFLTFTVGFSQNDYKYGHIPFIRNFTASEYKGIAQNWSITENNDHFIFIGNGSSILMFDGVDWHKSELSKKQDVRSLVKNSDGTIYVGGNNEFGKVYFSKQGKFSYKRLSDSTQEYGIFWNVYNVFDKIVYISNSEIVILENDSIVKTINAEKQTKFDKSILFYDKIICYIDSKKDSSKYCSLFDGESFTPIKNSVSFLPKVVYKNNNQNYIIDKYGEIREIAKTVNGYKLINLDKRLGNLNLEGNKEAIPNLDINTIAVKNNMIAVGTDGNGIYLFNLDGELIRTINKTDGLNNQQIRHLHFDQFNNLWSANDNEIFLIDLSNPVCFFDSKDGITSILEDISFKNNNSILLATHLDLYKNQVSNNKMRFISTKTFLMDIYQIKQFVFDDSISKTLIVANNGIYELLENGKNHLISDMYAWDLHQSSSNPNRIWVALDGDGVGSLIYNPSNQEIKLEKYTYKNTFGEVRKVVEHNNTVYYTVRDGGIALLDTTKKQENNYLNNGFIDYGKDTKYSQYNLCVFNNEVFIGSDNGIYIIKENKVKPFSEVYNLNYFNHKDLSIHRFYNEDNKKLWIVSLHNSGKMNEQLEIGYIDFSDEKLKYTSQPFNSIEEVIHSIKKDNNGNLWFAGVKKLYVYNPKIDISSYDSSECYISQITLKNDSTISSFLNYNSDVKSNIEYNSNSITFKFAYPSYVGGAKNEFSTFLVGIDEQWSDWSPSNSITYPRLDNGDYTFRVKAKNYYGQESKIAFYKFTILPPWYKTWWAFVLYFLVAVLLIYIIIKISLKRVQEQNVKLEKIVEERTAEVEHQKHEIELKNKDIVDSIIYAKRIQNTILPPKERLDDILENYFVIYKPKDIVSGDFYWADLLDGKSYFSAIDCTGHGVPGAFVSIVGFNGLKRTVNEFKVREPGKILDKLTDIVVDTFTASESHLKDGMDLSLCSLDYSSLTLEYAGANNSLIIIREGEIIEVKANKQPIGEFDNRVPFTNHKIQLHKGDCIFLFSDGYADQFGGPKGKKFKLKTLKNLFVKIAHLSPQQQKEELENSFNNWKGEIEQLDDVCLIGVKI